MTQFSNQDLEKEREEKLGAVHRQAEEARTEALALQAGFNYINLAKEPVSRDSLNLILQKDAERIHAVVIQKKGLTLKIGAVDPKNEEARQVFERLKSQGFQLDIFMVSSSALATALGEYKYLPPAASGAAVSGQVSLEKIETLKKELTGFDVLKTKIAAVDQSNTSLLLEIFLSAALTLDASDIHVEPQENQTQIRLRLDGILQEAGSVAGGVYQSLLARIKLLAGLQLNVNNIPQDGRFTIKESGVDVEVRVSVLPGAYGEYIVLRILNPNAIKLETKDLGLRDYLWQKLAAEIKKPTGIVLVTGPTGSGKTTTLYAFLKHLNKPGVKIVTLEDPIEYHLAGINQSQIEPEKNYTFAQGLRSVLRQDPDIILVGEIRDGETADTALHAALTGHLVFSTLHTNDAVGAVPRFLDLNAKPQILASALNAVIGQRLVRKLCAACKKPAALESSTLEKIKQELYASPAVEKLFPWPGEVKIYEPAGCAKCGGAGYKGRIGIHEVLKVTSTIGELVNNNGDQK